MLGQTKLLLIPCSGLETKTLAEEIYQILHQDYGLENQVEILLSKRMAEVDKETPKAHRHPLVSDSFADREVDVDIGANQLKDVIRGKHVVLVEHLLTPYRKVSPEDSDSVSVNDHIMTVRGFLEVIGNVDTLQRTLATPYLAYVRSHSVEKYQKRGFYQFDSLRLMLQDLQKGGLDVLATIDPHSLKAAQLAEELGMAFHIANPFQSGRAINPYKLGLSGEKSREIIKRLRPFHELIVRLKEQQSAQHLYFVSVDDGTEHRVENVVDRAFPKIPSEEAYALLAYFEKDRFSYDGATSRFKPFSPIKESNIDKEGTYIIIDDMFASGSTAMKAAKIFKEHGAKQVVGWMSHAVTTPLQHRTANDRKYLDKVVCLDTVPQHPDLNVEYIKASADLLAAELYKAHQKLVASR
ncbi:ribose-phosphate pyrophosphokinase [Candidatus Woesearchaeota archaeon]|nr:ribose-phosphate pyrophosphokinase [Candidatus Woesearchaeota archaeon]